MCVIVCGEIRGLRAITGLTRVKLPLKYTPSTREDALSLVSHIHLNYSDSGEISSRSGVCASFHLTEAY